MPVRSFFLLFCLLLLPACSEIQLGAHVAKKIANPSRSEGYFKVGNPYKISGKKYYPKESYDLVETGIASWYGPNFHGKRTANGEIFDRNELTAAHRTLQMPSLVRVTNLDNGRSLVVRVNDRGPYKRGRIIDLSERAAKLLGYKEQGTARVRIEVLKEESMAVARAAKRGVDTSGVEVAMNQNPPPPAAPEPVHAARGVSAGGYQSASVQPVESETLKALPGHTAQGRFLPDPVVTQVPVTKTSMYVQAGAFSVEENALRHVERLRYLAPAKTYPVMVNGQTFHRVRLGPFSSVEQADAVLNRLVAENNSEAIIVVEQGG